MTDPIKIFAPDVFPQLRLSLPAQVRDALAAGSPMATSTNGTIFALGENQYEALALIPEGYQDRGWHCYYVAVTSRQLAGLRDRDTVIDFDVYDVDTCTVIGSLPIDGAEQMLRATEFGVVAAATTAITDLQPGDMFIDAVSRDARTYFVYRLGTEDSEGKTAISRGMSPGQDWPLCWSADAPADGWSNKLSRERLVARIVDVDRDLIDAWMQNGSSKADQNQLSRARSGEDVIVLGSRRLSYLLGAEVAVSLTAPSAVGAMDAEITHILVRGDGEPIGWGRDPELPASHDSYIPLPGRAGDEPRRLLAELNEWLSAVDCRLTGGETPRLMVASGSDLA
jgi:hypothetical protein